MAIGRARVIGRSARRARRYPAGTSQPDSTRYRPVAVVMMQPGGYAGENVVDIFGHSICEHVMRLGGSPRRRLRAEYQYTVSFAKGRRMTARLGVGRATSTNPAATNIETVPWYSSDALTVPRAAGSTG